MNRVKVFMNSLLKSEFITKIIIVAMSIGITLIIILPTLMVGFLKKIFA